MGSGRRALHLHPAPPVAAAGILAGSVSAALAHRPAAVHRLLPRLGGDARDRGALALAERPPDRVDQLAAGTATSSSRRVIRPWLAPAPSAVIISLRRCLAGIAAIA